MNKKRYVAIAISWTFYLIGFVLLEKLLDDWRIGIAVLVFIAGNNIEKKTLDN